jgi:hypothetical protein
VRLKHATKYAGRAGAVAVPATALVATALVTTSMMTTAGASPSTARTSGLSSAFGVSATGLVNVPQIPQVSSATGPRDKSLVELPPNPLVKLKVLHTSAATARSRASVVDLRIAQAALTAHLVTAKCSSGQGSSHLVKASLAGHRLAVDAAPNTALSVPIAGVGTASVTLNKQARNADGSLTVTAIEVKLALATGQAQAIDISSATCSAAQAPTPPTPTPTSTPPGQAPAPSPIPTDLPVTG